MSFGGGYDEGSVDIRVIVRDDGTTEVTPSGTTNNVSSGTSASIGGGALFGFSGYNPTSETTDNMTAPTVALSPPIANFSFAAFSGLAYSFQNLSLNGATSYLWDFGDGNTSTEENPNHTYSGTGVFNVILTATNDGGSDTKVIEITVATVSPTVTFTFDVGAFTTWFHNNSTRVVEGYLWDFGDGTTSTETDPIHTYTINGTFEVKLTSGGITHSEFVTIDSEITLQWDDNSSDETGFRIEHSPNGIDTWTTVNTVSADVTSYGVTQAVDGIDSSESNWFRVFAFSAGGDSANPTNIIQVQCS